MRISYSAINTYQNCPLKYKLKEIDKVKEPKSKEQIFGTLLHSTLQFIHTPGFSIPTLEQALDYFAKHWNNSVFENEIEERSAFSQGIDIIQRYYSKNEIASVNIVDLESRFEIEMRNPKNPSEIHIVSGIIDRIDKTLDGYEIIDYKTTRKMPSQKKIDTDLQLSIYLKAFLQRYPKEQKNIDHITVSLYFLKHTVKLSGKRTLEQIKELDVLFFDVIHHIENKEFEPRVSALCNWCGYQKICPMWRHKFQETRKFETGDIRQAIEDYLRIKNHIQEEKREIEHLQEILTTYMDQEGVDRIFGEKKLIERVTRKVYAYEEDSLRLVLEPLHKWDSVLKIDMTAIRKLLGEVSLETRKKIESLKKIEKETRILTVKKSV